MNPPTKSDPSYKDVVEANLTVFNTLAASYNETEPHFSPENKARVQAVLRAVMAATGSTEGQVRLLDVGCGTGFMIDLARPYCAEIHGVDISAQMLSRVRTDGPCRIVLQRAETGAMVVPTGFFDVVTAYSFLHHLKDIKPTLERVFQALRPDGCFYADLEPNGAFLDAISALDRGQSHDLVIQREIDQITIKDAEIAGQLKVPTGTFQSAEFGKSLKGGFHETELVSLMAGIGFRTVKIGYNWFLGQGTLINDPALPREQRLAVASAANGALQRALPVSRPLFKYLSIQATK